MLFKNNDPVTVMHRIFRRHFNNSMHITVRDNNSIKNWLRNFRSTGSATYETPEARSELCGHQKARTETSRYRSRPQKLAHRHSFSCTRHEQVATTDTAIWFTFSRLQITHFVRTVSPWFCFEGVQFVSNFFTLVDQRPDIICHLLIPDVAHF